MTNAELQALLRELPDDAIIYVPKKNDDVVEEAVNIEYDCHIDSEGEKERFINIWGED